LIANYIQMAPACQGQQKRYKYTVALIFALIILRLLRASKPGQISPVVEDSANSILAQTFKQM